MGDLSKYSWYHGSIQRPRTEGILTGKSPGTFLVRDSNSVARGYVLSVSENGKVSHYIINNNGTEYQIGDKTFQTLPEIIEFYKKYLLDKTTLKEPVPKPEEVRALFNFDATDAEDLPFKKGDILTVIKKVEENWWRAKNSQGREGMIPKTYVQPNDNNPAQAVASPPTVSMANNNPGTNGGRHSDPDRASSLQPNLQRLGSFGRHSFPGDRPQVNNIPNDGCEYAIATMDHLKPYDDSLLSFMTGETIQIVKKNEDGSWFGEDKNGKTGTFPFTYVRLVQRDGMNGL